MISKNLTPYEYVRLWKDLLITQKGLPLLTLTSTDERVGETE